jgi:hypothetical protein
MRKLVLCVDFGGSKMASKPKQRASVEQQKAAKGLPKDPKGRVLETALIVA